MRRTTPDPRLLTEVELEIMQILWDRGEGTVNDVRDALPAERDLAYTSVSTVLRILEKKGVTTSRKEGRGHVYRPTMSRSEHEGLALHHLVCRVFDGEPTSLVARLLDSEGMSPEALAALRRLIDERLP